MTCFNPSVNPSPNPSGNRFFGEVASPAPAPAPATPPTPSPAPAPTPAPFRAQRGSEWHSDLRTLRNRKRPPAESCADWLTANAPRRQMPPTTRTQLARLTQPAQEDV